MSYNRKEQEQLNESAATDPRPGDYWHEMFCPYFMVMQAKGDEITILNCLPHRGVSARKAVDAGSWTFDVSKSMVVNREWINQLVRYERIDGFVADVSRGSERNQAVVDEWIRYRSGQLIKELKDLGPEVSRQMLMEQW